MNTVTEISAAPSDAAICPVVLCGGSGTRLWPLSRKALPKQFVPLVGKKSLLHLTLERLAHVGHQVGCVASEEHRFLVQEAMDAADVTGPQVLEPVGRNTAAAMAVAALLAAPDDLLLFAPADHHVPDADLFARTVRQGAAAAQAGYIVTFGVVPTFPSTAYGYIQPGADLAGQAGRTVDRSTCDSAAKFKTARGRCSARRCATNDVSPMSPWTNTWRGLPAAEASVCRLPA